MNFGTGKLKASNTLRKNFKKDLKNLNISEPNKNNKKDKEFNGKRKKKRNQTKKKQLI